MDFRAILAVILTIAAFVLANILFPGSPKNAPGQAVQQQVSSSSLPKKAMAPSAAAVALPVPAQGEKEIIVDTDLYTATFSSRGAVIKKFVLKNFKESANGGSVNLIAEEVSRAAFQTGAKGFPLDPQALYSISAKNLRLGKGEKQELQFVNVSQGIVTRKSFQLSGDGYGIGFEYNITNTTGGTISGSVNTIIPFHLFPAKKLSRFEASGAVTLAAGDFHNDKTAKIEKEAKNYTGRIDWAGFIDNYFLTAIVENNGSMAGVRYEKSLPEYMTASVLSPSLKLGSGESTNLSYTLYLGPKDLHLLKAQGHDLEKALDLGWSSVIAKPLLLVLKFLYGYVHNYGIAIIIITFIIKLLFVPLTHKSYVSMKEMQKVQPKMMELREKHKNDKDAMNRAMIDLYRTHKVNPLGGCLPMLVQIPVFMALYTALMHSIELRHAPFMLWIQDLSSKDPYYITPIIMGATMLLQQKMTPTTGMDPIQAKMMMFLPIIFTAMFLNFPAGLVLYWLINNILTIAQQYYINKFVKV